MSRTLMNVSLVSLVSGLCVLVCTTVQAQQTLFQNSSNFATMSDEDFEVVSFKASLDICYENASGSLKSFEANEVKCAYALRDFFAQTFLELRRDANLAKNWKSNQQTVLERASRACAMRKTWKDNDAINTCRLRAWRYISIVRDGFVDSSSSVVFGTPTSTSRGSRGPYGDEPVESQPPTPSATSPQPIPPVQTSSGDCVRLALISGKDYTYHNKCSYPVTATIRVTCVVLNSPHNPSSSVQIRVPGQSSQVVNYDQKFGSFCGSIADTRMFSITNQRL
jgi:hypothetical protein